MICILGLLLGATPGHAVPSDYGGHYELARPDPDRAFSLDVTIKDNKESVSFSAGHPDGSGAAPDADGEGQVDDEGKLTFTFKDSFDNEGTGTLVAAKTGYMLTLTLTKTVDPRVLGLYDKAVLKKMAALP